MNQLAATLSGIKEGNLFQNDLSAHKNVDYNTCRFTKG